MARVRFDLDTKGLYELGVIKKLMRLFPDMRGDLLAFIGNAGRNKLRREHLTGQDLTLRAREQDKLGRRTVNYSVNKRTSQTTITSYPVNFFEHGYLLHGRLMPARKIITGKLKTTMAGNLQRYIDAWENINLKKFINEAEQ